MFVLCLWCVIKYVYIFAGQGVLVYEVKHQIAESVEQLQEIARARREDRSMTTPLMNRFTPDADEDTEEDDLRFEYTSSDSVKATNSKTVDMNSLTHVK